jgi:hypothetical protein
MAWPVNANPSGVKQAAEKGPILASFFPSERIFRRS